MAVKRQSEDNLSIAHGNQARTAEFFIEFATLQQIHNMFGAK